MPKPTTKADWKTLEPPTAREPLHYAQTFSAQEMDQLRGGVVPQQMEDKWFIYYQEGWLYLHRSWSGALIYWLKLDESTTGARTVEAFVNRDPAQYAGTNIAYDLSLLDFLLRGMVLGQVVPFPVSQTVTASGLKNLYQHHVIGHIDRRSSRPTKRGNAE